MPLGTWFHGPRRLLLVFLVIVLLPSTLLVASGWRLMQQEELLARQEQQTQRDQMADLVVANLQQQFVAIEALLRGTPTQLASADVADDSVLVVVEGNEFTTIPERRLLHYPIAAPGREAPPGAFDEGERMELRSGQDMRDLNVSREGARIAFSLGPQNRPEVWATPATAR